ncbi:MAG: type II toxin-antitoxin system HicA family toxin [Bryobacteraceae bacterium]
MRYRLGRLRVLSGSDLCQILKDNGFAAVRQRGSHRIMQKRVEGTTITVPVPLHDSVRRGTLLSIVRQSGLPRTLFETDE